ncbi:MAG TPA: hypothetical protein VGK74_14235 [Symbiobacteriaceae bacterium]|jgi:5'-methylthioadenosine phosphorylase
MCEHTVLILPPAADLPEPLLTMQTPYGPAAGFEQDGLPVLVRSEAADVRALIYAAKELGARRVLAADAVQAVSGLLEPGDLVIPVDVIDQTRLRPFTFFVGKGYGFIKLNPPFCPDLMAALRTTARAANPRSFSGGVYVCAEGPRDATPAERRMYRGWGADVVGGGLLPEAYLARELELCYAALTVIGPAVIGSSDLYDLLTAAAAMAAGTQPCACGESMKMPKALGVVGPDWHTWLG